MDLIHILLGENFEIYTHLVHRKVGFIFLIIYDALISAKPTNGFMFYIDEIDLIL